MPMTEKRLELVRGLGAWASAAIVIGTMIGTGIFLKPAEMAREGPALFVGFAAGIGRGGVCIFCALFFPPRGSSARCCPFLARYLSRNLARPSQKRAANTRTCAAHSARCMDFFLAG